MTGVTELHDARAQVSRILVADLDELTGHGRLSVVPGVAETDWDLPVRDRRALFSYGLPPARDDALDGVVGAYQSGRDPELECGGSRLYALGMFGAARIAARPATGTVLAIPGFTYEDVHPQLRHRFPDGVRPTLMNSAVECLVDFAWRWHWILPVLTALQVRADAAEQAAWRGAGTPAAVPDLYTGITQLCGEIVIRFRQVDEAAVANVDSVWHETLTEIW